MDITISHGNEEISIAPINRLDEEGYADECKGSLRNPQGSSYTIPRCSSVGSLQPRPNMSTCDSTITTSSCSGASVVCSKLSWAIFLYHGHACECLYFLVQISESYDWLFIIFISTNHLGGFRMKVHIIHFIINFNKWRRRLKVRIEKHSKRHSDVEKEKNMQLRLYAG